MQNRPSFEQAQRLLAVARGEVPAATVLRGARVLNVFTGEFLTQDVAIEGDRIAGLGNYEGHEVIDLSGRYLVPGFIDGHMHLESSMVTPWQFARAVVPRGTTTVITDPHEIANVWGARGIQYLLESSEGLPLDMWVMRSSCVPATHLENAGARLEAAELAQLRHPRLLGLAGEEIPLGARILALAFCAPEERKSGWVDPHLLFALDLITDEDQQRHYRALLEVARGLLQLGRHQEALALLEQASEKTEGPQRAEAQLLLAGLEARPLRLSPQPRERRR